MIGAKTLMAHWDASREMRAVVGGLGLVLPQPDVIYTAAFEPDFPAFLRTLRAVGVESAVIAADGRSGSRVSLQMANGVGPSSRREALRVLRSARAVTGRA